MNNKYSLYYHFHPQVLDVSPVDVSHVSSDSVEHTLLLLDHIRQEKAKENRKKKVTKKKTIC